MIVVIEATAMAPRTVQILQCFSVFVQRPEGEGVATVEVEYLANDPDERISVDVHGGDTVTVYSNEGAAIYETIIV